MQMQITLLYLNKIIDFLGESFSVFFDLRFLLEDEARPDVRGRSPGRLQRPRTRSTSRRFGKTTLIKRDRFDTMVK